MEFFMKLPRNKGEFALFVGVISILSVHVIAPLITCFEGGFHWFVCRQALQVLPMIWISVVAVVLLTYVPAEKLTRKIVSQGDSFRAQVTVNILCTVFLMSVILTVLGTWIGTGSVTWEPIQTFFFKWPRNFAISLAVELCFAQPIARLVIWRFHLWLDRRACAVRADDL